MDMWKPFRNSVIKGNAPNARITFDKFHGHCVTVERLSMTVRRRSTNGLSGEDRSRYQGAALHVAFPALRKPEPWTVAATRSCSRPTGVLNTA